MATGAGAVRLQQRSTGKAVFHPKCKYDKKELHDKYLKIQIRKKKYSN
jgi:hypothetical protein